EDACARLRERPVQPHRSEEVQQRICIDPRRPVDRKPRRLRPPRARAHGHVHPLPMCLKLIVALPVGSVKFLCEILLLCPACKPIMNVVTAGPARPFVRRLLLMNSIPRPEHPKPQFRRNAWMNLNGEWAF